jgi:hypothetical protein
VQNAGTADANITIAYIRGSHGASGLTETATIKPGASAYFDQQTGSTTRNCSTLAGADGKFIGAAKITSNQPVVATLMQLGTGASAPLKVMMGYNGFAAGSSTVSLPLIMANNSGFYSGFQVQNIGTIATDVTAEYSANTAGVYNPPNDTATCLTNLQPNQSCTVIQNAGTWAGKGKYIGGATLTSSNGQALVAIVNQVYPGTASVGPFGTSYEGFNPATATDKISAPLIMANNSGFYTGIQVLNTGAGNCAAVNITYTPTVVSGGNQPANESFSLAGNTSKTIIQNSTPPSNGSVNNWNTVGKYIGGAEVSAPGCTIVAIINQVRMSAGDNFLTYDGFNH